MQTGHPHLSQNQPADGLDHQPDAPRVWPGWLVLFVVVGGLYTLTASRGPQRQDSGEQIWRIVTGQLSHRLGLALIHPLHHWLGRWVVSFDLLEPCFAITLISAFAGGLTIANVYGCVLTLTRNRWASWLAAGSLAVAHTHWQMATRTETYTLTTALFSAECWSLILFAMTRRPHRLLTAMLLNGLGLANHLLALLTTPVLIVIAC